MISKSHNHKKHNNLSLTTFSIVTLAVLAAAALGCYLASGDFNILNETAFSTTKTII